MRELARDLLDLLLPPRCAGCRRTVARDATLCRACDRELLRIEPGACTLCQEQACAKPGGRCAACAVAHGPLAACCAAAYFEGAAARWVKRFKYPALALRGLDPGAEAVALALLREALARMPGTPPDAIVPVPLHPVRIRARGFQPAAVLAAHASDALGVPLLPRLLARTRDTPSQTGKGRAERRRNVAGCFAAASGRPLPHHVWLVDDVVTTAATLGEAARVLRRAGVRRVAAVCLARTSAGAR